MIPIYQSKNFQENFLNIKKENQVDEKVYQVAKEVIADIRVNGDVALEKYVAKFDRSVPKNWEVTTEERESAWNQVDPNTIDALKRAGANIKAFHKKQLQSSKFMQVDSDIVSGQLFRAIERVGIYVPGGTACYPSSVLMNAIPAVLAGVDEVIMVTPARDGEEIAPILSVAADIAGVDRIFKIGGIQAIAALTYGTESVPTVDKIVGPGNAYVAAAKSLVFGDVGIDMIAGPSEVAIIADDTANPVYVAADLIAQSEHDKNARSFLFSTSKSLIEATNKEVEKQCAVLPRQEIAGASLQEKSALVYVSDIEEAFRLANKLAPEHLEIQLDNPLDYLGKIKNAGSVFLGHYTPESLGDYYAGPNHVLPTSGTARFSSGLSVDDFIKKTTFLYYSENALQQASDDVMTIAKEEFLDGHARAVEKRLKKN
ncbi:histidinol dehydrogenase [Paraliobacillus quinghaiensis]|uniref:Histidinol dehydrogenase n=1 Tax=Paraliobacillus quinghaiensis TaxID=470815 RepID=A0A917WX95_9BACI|nr:histidinol dehydrogenase [Paraliobacillus quinghaiensis]GGM37772.1 histidinol dehydrogenase [Paraliobacillus quinghaiensis]